MKYQSFNAFLTHEYYIIKQNDTKSLVYENVTFLNNQKPYQIIFHLTH